VAFLEWSRDWKLEHEVVVTLPGLNYVHDFAASPNWLIAHMSPFVSMSNEALVSIIEGKSSPGESMRYYPELPSRIVLIERYPAAGAERRIVQLDTEPCHIYHYGHCHEDSAAGTLHFTAVCLGKKFTMEWQHKLWLSNAADEPGMLYDFKAGGLQPGGTPAMSRELADQCSCEFPCVHPYRHISSTADQVQPPRYTYLMAAADGKRVPFTTIVKHDALKTHRDSWHSHGVIGEPCFVPRLGRSSMTQGDEDDGWILAQVYDTAKHTTHFVVLDARHISAGPVCTLHLRHFIPYAFHGTFTPNVFVLPPASVSMHSKL